MTDQHLTTLACNFAGSIRYETLNGRSYIVAPLSMIVPGVLNGSKGPLLYPLPEIQKNADAWNGIPIVVNHPTDEKGNGISARHPKVLEESGIGQVFNTTVKGKLTAEGWFDVAKTNQVQPSIISSLQSGQPIELSTGLFTKNIPSKGVFNSKQYTYIATNYRPDHLAVLPDKKGACSLEDGCGVLINAFCPTGRGGGINPTCSPGKSGPRGSRANKKEWEFSKKLALAKIKNAPVPSNEAIAKALKDAAKGREGKGRVGGDARGGSSADRRRQRMNLFKEFGGEKLGYIVCPWTGLKMHWSDDPKINPKGYPKFERGKIFTKCQGGGYQLPNLIPESFAANRARNDTRVRKENSRAC